MSKYIYPYQRILEMKVKEKENAQLLMAKAVQKQTNIESRIMDLQSTITTVQEQLSSEQNVGMPILQLRMIGDYVSNLQKRVGIERIQLDFAKKNVDKKQEVLRDALKEEKTWDLLKEKKQQEHLEFIKQKEQSQLDEISNQMFYRQMEAKG